MTSEYPYGYTRPEVVAAVMKSCPEAKLIDEFDYGSLLVFKDGKRCFSVVVPELVKRYGLDESGSK